MFAGDAEEKAKLVGLLQAGPVMVGSLSRRRFEGKGCRTFKVDKFNFRNITSAAEIAETICTALCIPDNRVMLALAKDDEWPPRAVLAAPGQTRFEATVPERAVTPPTSPERDTADDPKITDLSDDSLRLILDLVLDSTDRWEQNDRWENKYHRKKPALAADLSLTCRSFHRALSSDEPEWKLCFMCGTNMQNAELPTVEDGLPFAPGGPCTRVHCCGFLCAECSPMMPVCEGCDGPSCPECWEDEGRTCDVCSKTYGPGCCKYVGYCELCEEEFCETCRTVRDCQECGRNMCDNCMDVIYCEHCDEVFCQECS